MLLSSGSPRERESLKVVWTFVIGFQNSTGDLGSAGDDVTAWRQDCEKGDNSDGAGFAAPLL